MLGPGNNFVKSGHGPMGLGHHFLNESLAQRIVGLRDRCARGS